MRSKNRFDWRESVPFWTLIIFLVAVFLFGGASRGDVQSLLLLRPLAVLACGIALVSLTWADIRANKAIFGMVAAIFALVGVHLIPLPPAIWGALPGRDLILRIDEAASLGAVWRPLTFSTYAGLNALFSLFVPLAVLLLGVQLDREKLFRILPVILLLGLASGFLGLIQAIGDPNGPLYFYRYTNNGAAVGLFANRNHQAVMLAACFPLLAVFASIGIRTEEQAQFRSILAIAFGVYLIPLLLFTGSRLGLLVGVIGLASSWFVYRNPLEGIVKKRKIRTGIDLRWPLVAFGVFGLVAVSIVFNRATSVTRLLTTDQSEEFRLQAWGPILEMGHKYLPFGSGVGSFVEAYKIDEPFEVLNPTYLNHAHNDYLEVYLTLGIPGIILVGAALFWLFRRAISVWKQSLGSGRDGQFARLGVALLLIFALASVSDYPLRVPSVAALFVVAVLWSSLTQTKKAGSPQDSSLAGTQGS